MNLIQVDGNAYQERDFHYKMSVYEFTFQYGTNIPIWTVIFRHEDPNFPILCVKHVVISGTSKGRKISERFKNLIFVEKDCQINIGQIDLNEDLEMTIVIKRYVPYNVRQKSKTGFKFTFVVCPEYYGVYNRLDYL